MTRAKTWTLVAAFYTIAALAYCWPLFSQFGSAVPSDPGDPFLIAWGLWWDLHAVPFTAAWWNAPIFAPMGGAFALSETFLGMTVVTAPLVWSGLGLIETYNVAYVLSFVAAALAAHALAWRLTGRHDAALIAGLAFGFSPYRASQMPHLHLLFSWWMPLGLLALHRFLERGRRRDLVLFGISWLLNGLTTGYYLMFFSLVVGFWVCWFARTRRQWIELGVTTVIASVPFVPLLLGYRRFQSALGVAGRSRGEVEAFSADLSAFWAVSEHAALPHHWTFKARPEGELYAGAAILAIVTIAVVAAWRRHVGERPLRIRRGFVVAGAICGAAALAIAVTGGWQGRLFGAQVSVTSYVRLLTAGIWLCTIGLLPIAQLADTWRRRSIFGFYVLSAVLLVVLALGPTPTIFGVRVMERAPYLWLMQLPGWDGLRVPARLGMLIILVLSQAAALAFTRLIQPGARVWTTALAAAVLIEGWVPHLQTAAIPPLVDLGNLDPNAAVLELPMTSLYSDTAAMVRATVHGRRLANGFSGFYPPHYAPLRTGTLEYDDAVLREMRAVTPLIVVIDRTRDPEGQIAEFIKRQPGVKQEFETTIGPAFTLPMQPRSSSPAQEGAALAIARVDVSTNPPLARAVADGDVGTIWQTVEGQKNGDEVRVLLGQPALVSAVRMSLGAHADQYPRRLRVAIQDGEGPPTTIWEGRPSGLVMAAAFEDPRRVSVLLSLARAARGTRVILTLTGDEPDALWTIADLAIIGTPVTAANVQ